MINLWKKLSDTYKILIAMLLLIVITQLGTLIYIWKYESEILLDKERKNLNYQLEVHCQRLEDEMNRLQKELEFLSILEVMDDILVDDIDKRIAILLQKKAKDLSRGIILEVFNRNRCLFASRQNYNRQDFLEFNIPIYSSFRKEQQLGKLSLLYPFENFKRLLTDNLYQRLWLKPPEKLDVPPFKDINLSDSICVSALLEGKLNRWRLFLSYNKEYALASIEEIEKILLFAFIFSLLLLLLLVWVFSKKQIAILENTQEILALKRIFLSTMSHELRTPLGSILNLTQHLMVNSKMGDEEIELLVRIENSSEHLLEMIDNLLQLSKLESNTMRVTRELIDVRLVTEEMIEMVEPLIDDKNLALEKDISKEEIFIHTDANLFKQVVLNLLSNAVKFTEKGSIKIHLIKKRDTLIFKVIDTGIGIGKDKQKSLFSEFYQAHSTTVKHSTGLGLALSQKVAKLIHGEIKIHSKGIGFGVEATFTFTSL